MRIISHCHGVAPKGTDDINMISVFDKFMNMILSRWLKNTFILLYTRGWSWYDIAVAITVCVVRGKSTSIRFLIIFFILSFIFYIFKK
jgi:hypothetical protein